MEDSTKKEVFIQILIPESSNNLEERIATANLIMAGTLEYIKCNKYLHCDTVDDIKYIIEDFLFSISDSAYDEFQYQYNENSGEEI